MKPLLASICLLSASLLTCAQTTTTAYTPRDYSVIPPSPEVASIIQSVDIPIDYFKGIPDISLPIYTIREGALSVPIVLQYQGGGIKVEQQEGNVGMGWTLHAGGVICRNVYGHPDEISRGGAKGLFNATNYDIELRNFARNTVADYDPSDLNYYKSFRSAQQQYSVNYEEGRSDMANDIFKINCMDLSGTFIYNDSRNLVLSSPSPFDISPSQLVSSYPPEFIITDTKGTKYYFNKQELTKYEYYYGSPGALNTDSLNYTSAWHLTKIKNIHNDSIVFKYEQTGKRDRYSEKSETVYTIDNTDLKDFMPKDVASRGQITYYPQMLTSIVSTAVTVKFVYGTGNNNQITNIRILPNDELCDTAKEYEFAYKQYRISSTGLIARPIQMLTSITENNKTKYKFSYYDSELPLDFYSQDFCGYYNGQTSNVGLSPASPADRDVAPDVVMMGSLKSIDYPTGGKTEFVWEPHEFGYVGDSRVQSHTTTTTTTTKALKTDTLVGLMDESVRKLKISDYVIPSGRSVNLDLTKYFLFNTQILMTTEYESTHIYNEGTGYIYNYPAVSFKSKTEQISGYNLVLFLDKNTIEIICGNAPITLDLPAGTYDVELHYPTDVYGAKDQIEQEFLYPDTNCGRIYLTQIASSSSSSTTTSKDYWGGVRISQIKSIADDNSTPVIKHYLYDSEDPDASSGIAPALPDFESCYYMTCPNQKTLGYDTAVISGSHSHGLYNTPVGNVGVEYSSVIESYLMVDKTSGMPEYSHRVNYRYSTQQSFDKHDYNNTLFRDYQPTGQQMWTSLAHRRGDLLTKNIMSWGTSKYEEYTYEYNIYEQSELSEFTTDLFKVSDFNHAAYGNDYSIGKYSLIPYTKTIRSETLTLASGHEQITEYDYFYDKYTTYLDSKLVKSKKITASNAAEKKCYYTYRTSYGIGLDFPETETTVVNGIIVDAKRMEYYDGSNLLKATYRLSEQGKSASEYNLGDKSASSTLLGIITAPEFNYKYNSYGNLVEISYNGNVLASYLWGYRGLFPIVEVKDLPYDSLVATLKSIGRHPDHFISSTATTASYLNEFFNDLRTALPQCDITTMTYHWVLGISTATDSRGITTHFTYDNWGRLTGIKDYNQYFINRYDYNFKGF